MIYEALALIGYIMLVAFGLAWLAGLVAEWQRKDWGAAND